MRLIRTAAPTLEPITIADVTAQLRIDDANAEPSPRAPSAALVAPALAGNVTAGVHRYRATFVTTDGETVAGDISDPVTVADPAASGQVALTEIPIGGATVVARRIYRTTAGGAEYFLVGTVNDNTTTSWTDNVADANLGAGAPAANTTGDPLLTGLIATAREQVEEYLGRALVTQSWRLTLDAFPTCDIIVLPRPNLLSVESVQYLDGGGALQTLSADDYQVDANGVPGRIVLPYLALWPATWPGRNAVMIDFTAGFGAPAAVPAVIKAAIKLLIGELFTAVEPPQAADVPAVRRLLDPWRYREAI